jgi:CBS domain-containing protein
LVSFGFIPKLFVMTTVASVLANKPRPFNYIEPDARVEDALHLLGAVNLSYLVVMHEDQFKGIFCEHDFCANVALRGWDPAICTVEDTMTHNLPIISPDDSIENCIRLFNAHKTRYLPVFDQYRFVGVVTHGDLIRALLRDGNKVFDGPSENIVTTEWYGTIW